MAIPGTNIRLLREQMGISQRQLAQNVGLDVSNLSRLERGLTDGTMEVIGRIADLLGVSVGVLYQDVDTVEKATLHMRNVPVLTPAQVAAWKGNDNLAHEEVQRFLHADLKRVSRHAFAVPMVDRSCVPELLPGDDLIFDPTVQPKRESFVIAAVSEAEWVVGYVRQRGTVREGVPMFEVVPVVRAYPVHSSVENPALTLVATLVEIRRYVG